MPASAMRVLIGASIVALAAPRVVAATPDPLADIDAQYQAVLAILKNPPASGVLITEVEPGSPAAGAGLRGGDIITEYYGKKIATLTDLRDQIAQAMGRHLEDPTSGDRVALRARRGPSAENPIAVQLRREPLGIRAVDVQAGVPGPRNPPANLRGTLVLDWAPLLQSAGDADEQVIALKTFQRLPVDAPPNSGAASTSPAPSPPGFQEDWLGWQTITLASDSPATISAQFELFRVDSEDPTGPPIDHSTFALQFHCGDFQTGPAFLLDQASAQSGSPGNLSIKTSATRTGGILRAEISAVGNGPQRVEYTFPQNAMIQPALPLVASALPHDAQSVFGLSLLSVRDFLPRPGYVLATRGKQALPEPTVLTPATKPGLSSLPAVLPAPPTAWQVDLLFCGVTIESYWFSDQRRLLASQSLAPQPLISRRVPSAKIAATPMVPKSATQPAPRDTPMPF